MKGAKEKHASTVLRVLQLDFDHAKSPNHVCILPPYSGESEQLKTPTAPVSPLISYRRGRHFPHDDHSPLLHSHLINLRTPSPKTSSKLLRAST